MTRIGLTLTPQDALFVQAALRYYIDTIVADDEPEGEYWLPLRRNRFVLARLARALHDRGYGYVEPVG